MGPFDMSQVLAAATPRVRVAAIGAMFLNESLKEPHDGLMQKGLCDVIGFEPVQEQCDLLNALHGPLHRYLPVVVGDGSRRIFHHGNASMTSSIYPPNDKLIRCFHQLPHLMQVVERREVQTFRLDDLPEVGDIDLFKIDVQGAELDVFRGAPRTLGNAVVVHTEVAFVPLYEGQPLFGEVDIALRQAGFLFHRFEGEIQGRSFRPLVPPQGPDGRMSQEMWVDAIYVKDFTRLGELSTRKRLVLAMLLHDVYRSYDLCAYVLHVQDQIDGSDFWAPYLTRLTGSPPPERLED